jgi:hypothetical protein
VSWSNGYVVLLPARAAVMRRGSVDRVQHRLVVMGVTAALLAGCTGDGRPETDRTGSRLPTTAASSGAWTPTASSSRTPTTAPPEPTAAPDFDRAAAMATVRSLTLGGPREATSPAYRRAADRVQQRLAGLGYTTRRQVFGVPAGESWGVAVGSGRTSNVVAVPADFDAARPHLVVGAHLDTVPRSPGAEDNGSGVAVLLELARAAAEVGTRLPVVWVAFGAEEPRGPADDEHHFGSQEYVARLDGTQRAALRGMVSLDRVGAPGRVPICTGGLSPVRVRRQLLAAADRAGVPARACENRTSDHWPFEKAGETVARVGGNDSPGYHSPRDRPSTVSPRQLHRVGAVLAEWLLPTR